MPLYVLSSKFSSRISEVDVFWYQVYNGFTFSFFLIMQRVIRPRGGINEWFHWLPVSLHKKLDYIFRQIYVYSHLLFASGEKKIASLPSSNCSSSSVGISSVLEADVKHIVGMAHKTFDKYILILFHHIAETTPYLWLVCD